MGVEQARQFAAKARRTDKVTKLFVDAPGLREPLAVDLPDGASVLLGTWSVYNVWRVRREYDEAYTLAYRELDDALGLTVATASTLAEGRRVFRRTVWDPVAGEPAGLPRLRAAMESWLTYLGDCPLPGGCMLTAASNEFDSHPGAVRDAVRADDAQWSAVLVHDAARAFTTWSQLLTGLLK